MKSEPGKSFFKEKWDYFIKTPFRDISGDSGSLPVNIKNLIRGGNSSIYRLLFLSTMVFFLFFLPAVSFDFGRNSDETASDNYGKDLLNYYLTGGKDQSIFNSSKQGYKDLVYYGLSFDLVCAVVNRYISPFGEFETRHLLIALCALIAMVSAAMIAKRLSNWRAAWLTVVFIFLTPVFMGHSMNNAKDIPFAAGYIIAVYFLIRILKTYPTPRSRVLLAFVLTTAFTGSNKINGWMMLNAYLVFFLAIQIVYRNFYLKTGTTEELKKFFPKLLLVMAGSYLLSIAFWPYSYANILVRPFSSMKIFENIGALMIHYEIFEGKLINMANVPWYYIFKFMLITIPLFVLAGFAVYLVSNAWYKKMKEYPLTWLLLFVTIVPVLFVIWKHSKVYNGWRHFLFIYPSFVILSVLGWEFLLQNLKNRIWRYFFVILLLGGMIKTASWAVANHPGQIGYFNELTGGVKGAYGKYEIDPLNTSGRRAIEWLIRHELKNSRKATVMSNIESSSLQYYIKDPRIKVQLVWSRGTNTSFADWDYLILSMAGMSAGQLQPGIFPPKGTIHTIEIGHVPVIAIVKKNNDFKFRGYSSLIRSNYDSAVHYFKKAVEYDSLDLEALDFLSSALIGKKEYRSALLCLNRVLNLNPEDAYAWENTGLVYSITGNCSKAVEYLERAISCRVNATEALKNLGKTWYNCGNTDSSLYYFGIYEQYVPGDVEVADLVARICLERNDPGAALQAYDKALKHHPGNRQLLKKKEMINGNRPDENLSPLTRLAIEYSRLGKMDSVISILTRAIHSDEDKYDAYVNRGVAYYQLKMLRESLSDFDQAIRLHPEKEQAAFRKGQVQNQVKDYAGALISFDMALKCSPGNPEILYERGIAYYNLKRFREAVSDYSVVLRSEKDFETCYYFRALAFLNISEFENALEDLNNAIRCNPDYLEAIETRSVVFIELKKFDEARKDIAFLKKKNYSFSEAYRTKFSELPSR